jgi:hypothetical protein
LIEFVERGRVWEKKNLINFENQKKRSKFGKKMAMWEYFDKLLRTQ